MTRLVRAGAGLRLGIVAAIAVALLIAGTTTLAQRPGGGALNPAFENLVDVYLKDVRGVGGRAPNDMSAQTFDRDLQVRRDVLKQLQAIDRKPLTFEQDIDYRFLESILKADIAEDEQVKRWQQNPRAYLNINTLNYRLDADPRSPSVRATELVDDLKQLQARMANGRKNLSQHVPRWIELTHPMLDGIETILTRQVTAFADRASDQKAALLAENQKTIAALKEFRTFISTELPRRPPADWRIGANLFNTLHETRYMFNDDDVNLRRIARGMPGFTRVPAYHDWGWKQFQILERQLEVQAKKIDPTRTWLQIIKDTKKDHPSAENLVFAHLEAARKSREWVIEKDLVSIPWKDDDAIMVAAAPNQWMTQWWGWGPGVPAGSKSRKSAWTIIPPNPAWSEDVIEDNLTEKDYSFMYAIATHEVYPGHHLQRLYQNENPRKLRVYESSYSNQAWCYYIEWELTPSYGFYPPDKQDLYTLEMLRLKLWRLGRVIIDSGLHTNRLGYDEAVQLESERIGFVRRGGQINIDSITEGGSGTAAATLGYYEWMLLREDYFKKMRELDQRGTLKDFHDRVYKIGFLPVTLVRESLMRQLEDEHRRPQTTSQQP